MRCLNVILFMVLATILCGCSEMGLDIVDAVAIQESVLEDNADANSTSTCILNFDTGIEIVDEEFVDTVTVELTTSCLQDVARDILERSTEEDDESAIVEP